MYRFFLVAICFLLLVGCWETSSGEKIGTIVKLAKEGIIFSTWEAEIIRGGLNNGSGSFGQKFEFTIKDEKLLEKAKKYFDEQREVKIKYHKEAFTLSWINQYHNGNYFLDSIEYAK